MIPLEIWMDSPNTIAIKTDGVVIQIPANEPSRVVAFIRNEYERQRPAQRIACWREGFLNSFEPDDKHWEQKIKIIKKERSAKQIAREKPKANITPAMAEFFKRNGL